MVRKERAADSPARAPRLHRPSRSRSLTTLGLLRGKRGKRGKRERRSEPIVLNSALNCLHLIKSRGTERGETRCSETVMNIDAHRYVVLLLPMPCCPLRFRIDHHYSRPHPWFLRRNESVSPSPFTARVSRFRPSRSRLFAGIPRPIRSKTDIFVCASISPSAKPDLANRCAPEQFPDRTTDSPSSSSQRGTRAS